MLLTQKDPVLMRFRATQGITPSLFVDKPVLEAFNFPLLFEPGDAVSREFAYFLSSLRLLSLCLGS
jgi:hypothetical protein